VNIKRALLMSGACGILATAVSTALAQETSEVAEVVIVTGSYIRGTAEDAALPVDVISAEELEKAGAPTTLELLKSLNVSNGVLGDTNQFDARAQGSEGSGSVNLRGLGAERTHGDFVREQIKAGRIAACHDVSDGGLLVALTEMAMAGGRGVALQGVRVVHPTAVSNRQNA